MLRAIEMGTEAHTLIGHFSQIGKAEDLIAAGIREDGVRPGHKSMKPTKLADQFVARAQIKMIGVGAHDFCAELYENFLVEALDCRLRAHVHESRPLTH